MADYQIGEPFNPYKMFVVSCLPAWLEPRTEISWTAKGLYGRLCRYAGNDGLAFPKIASLARDIGVSRSAIDRALAELKRHRLIAASQRGFRRSNSYVFLYHEWINENLATSSTTYQDGIATSSTTLLATSDSTHIRESIEENHNPKRENDGARKHRDHFLRVDTEESDPFYGPLASRVSKSE